MRAIRIYSFDVNKTVRFSQLPDIIHEYLERERLTADRFLYCLEAIELQTNNPCEKAVKDCPKLGAVKKLPSPKEVNMFDELQVSNIIEDTNCTEADIIPFLKRYERTYGAMDTNFFYYDIDFFGKSTAFFRDRSRLNPNLFLSSDEPCLASQVYGSGICIYRTDMGAVGLELGIDVLHDGVLYDPEPYYKSMCELLPGAKSRTELRVFLTEAEKAAIAASGAQAQPILDECRGYLKEKLPSKERQTFAAPIYKIAPLLKKFAKKAGYSYSYEPYGCYALRKRLPRGHFLKLELESPPSHFRVGLHLTLEGLGFSDRLVGVVETPGDQAELDAWLNYVFEVLAGFEKEYAPSLDALYDPTPDWYTGTD